MVKLIFSLDGAFLGEFPLDKECLTIGRRPTSDIHIDNLAISGDHATVSIVGNDTILEDLDSTNGTLVNGTLVKRHVLQHGDIIGLGKYQLRYVNEAVISAMSGGAGSDDFEKTMIIRPSATQTPPAGSPAAMLTPAPVAEPVKESPPLAQIQVLTGPGVGKMLELNKSLVTIGKPGLQVAVITRRPHGYFITHVEGLNHPVVNGVSVGAQAAPLKDHDVIEVAGVKMEFYLVSA